MRGLRSARLTVVTALLAGSLGLPAEAARRVDPEAARRALARAAERCDLRGGSAENLRLRALVRALRLSTGEHSGRYELAWHSEDRWRQEVRFEGYHSVDARDGEGTWRSSGVPWVPVRVRQIQEGLDVASLLRLAPAERVASARSARGASGRLLEIELAGGEAGPRRVTLDEALGLPRLIEGPQLRHEFSGWRAIGELAFPGEITVSDSGGAVATATLRRLAQEAYLPPALFERPPGARPSDHLPEPDAPEWEAYRARLASFFRRSWRLPREARLGREGVVRLAFAVRRDGEIRNLRLLESSGSEELDHAALAAIAAATPLPTPPLPEEEEALEITWSVVYNLEEGASAVAGDADARRERRYADARPVSGRSREELAGLDELILEFLAEQDAPGAALAVMRDGRLVHARGYGWADADSGEPVQPDSLFRIASVSKPLTAMTVLALVESGLLQLDDSPWQHLGLEQRALTADPRHGRLTLKLLLQHRGGFDRRQATDDLLLSGESGRARPGGAAPSKRGFVEGLASRPLDFEPGTRFAYSNAGYALLGRVIEAAAGVSYEQAVRERVLEPLGLTSFRLGRSHAEHRAPGEVKPHLRDPATAPAADGSGRLLPLAEGGFALETMDAQGGWLASAVDLARLAAALEHPRRSGVLSRRSVRRLWARPPGLAGHDVYGRMLAEYYGCGWKVRVAGPRGALEQWHDGRLPGSSSLLVRQPGGLQWALLFNQDRGADGTLLAQSLEPRLRELLSRTRDRPGSDLAGPGPG